MRSDAANRGTRRLLAVGLGAGALLALSGCVGEPSTGESAGAAVHELKAGSQESRESPDVSSDPSTTSGDPAPAADLTANNFGTVVSEAQLAASTVRVTSELPLPPGPSLVITGDASVDSADDDYRARIVSDQGYLGNVEARVVDGHVYVHSGAGQPSGSTDRPWKLAEISDIGNPHVRDIQQLVQLTDPARIADFYANAQEVGLLGYDVIDGVPAWCYRVTIAAASAIDESRNDADQAKPKLLEMSLPDSYDMKVCVDEAQRPVTTKVMPRGVELHFSDWGMPVEVETPPVSQVSMP